MKQIDGIEASAEKSRDGEGHHLAPGQKSNPSEKVSWRGVKLALQAPWGLGGI